MTIVKCLKLHYDISNHSFNSLTRTGLAAGELMQEQAHGR